MIQGPMSARNAKTLGAQYEPDPDAFYVKEQLLEKLKNSKRLMGFGDGDSSDGSDSEPSGDNLEPEALIRNLPVVDK
jgi:hypothetical protein